MTEVISIGIRTLEALFVSGMLSSAILVLLTAVEDMETVLGSKEAASTPNSGSH